MAKVLIVDDEKDVAEVISISLSANGFTTELVDNGSDALALLRVYKYDLVILDWMMPELSGIDVLKQYRKTGGTAPILMLTAKADVDDKETGLDGGADDYLIKPFEVKELLARARALIRRPAYVTDVLLAAGDITLNPASCQVTKNGEEIQLRPMAYKILEFLLRHPNQVFSAETIQERVWNDTSLTGIDTVRTHIKLLRKAIDSPQSKSIIKTVHGHGYILEK